MTQDYASTVTGMSSEARVWVALKYAAGKGIVNRNCLCGNMCDEYAEWIVKYSKQYGVFDPMLVASLMMQESGCTNEGCNSAGYAGLMQISCTISGWQNTETNIKAGIRELRGKYDTYRNGMVFEGCSGRRILYTEWKAALRGYNGWGCDPSLPEQDYYVDEIWSRFQSLKKVT